MINPVLSKFSTNIISISTNIILYIKLSLDDFTEIMSIRGIKLSHQTVHNWSQIFAAALGLKIRKARKGKSGKQWHVDATYLKIEGKWCYLYRAIDKEGNLVDVCLSNTRD
ncbi:MAG: IS6 family transposase [Legionellales bacterium]|nr:IS6 family transposase [Legionellales bacterium]